MAKTDRLVATILESLRNFFTNTEHPPVGGVTGQPQLRSGNGIPALDNFDGDCALLFLSVTSRFRTTEFPNQTVTAVNCGTSLAVQVQIGVSRCSQALTWNGGLPDAETMAAEFDAQEDDADRLDRAFCVAAKAAQRAGVILDWTPISAEVLGPEGATVAVVAQALFHLP